MGVIRRHPVLAAVLAVAIAVVGTVVVTGVAVWRAAHHDDAAELATADVIAVLGAAQYGGKPSPVFRGRLEHADLLYEQGRAEQVIVLGANQPGDSSTEAEAGRDYLIEQGVPADAVVAEAVGRTSYESLEALAGWMDDRGMDSAFLVSDPWHNLRIERMASDLGFDGHASATWTSAAKSEDTRLTGYVRETFAYLYYRLAGR